MTLPNTSCSPDEGHCVLFGRCLEASFDTEMDSFVYLFSCSTGPRWTAAKMHKLKSEYESERQANISDSNTSDFCSSHTKSLFEETQHAIRRRPALDVVPTKLEVICFGERPNPNNMCWNLPGIPAPLNLCGTPTCAMCHLAINMSFDWGEPSQLHIFHPRLQNKHSRAAQWDSLWAESNKWPVWPNAEWQIHLPARLQWIY